jgi:hypothetical protein
MVMRGWLHCAVTARIIRRNNDAAGAMEHDRVSLSRNLRAPLLDRRN